MKNQDCDCLMFHWNGLDDFLLDMKRTALMCIFQRDNVLT